MADTVHRRHREQAEGVEGGHEAVRDLVFTLVEQQQTAPFGTPARRQSENIGGMTALALHIVVMASEEVAGPVGGGLGMTHYPTGTASNLGAASKGWAVLGIGLTAYSTYTAYENGDDWGVANGGANIGASTYALIAGGPVGWTIGAGQAVIGAGQYGWELYWNDYANDSTESAAANMTNMIAKTLARIKEIDADMWNKGCP